MVEDTLPVDRQKAGADYYKSLLALGLNPEALFWVRYDDREQWHLLVISSHLDDRGPLEISQLLFKAYNASALPKEIDPFDVDVYSPEQALSKQIFAAADGHSLRPSDFMDVEEAHGLGEINIKFGSLLIPVNGIYAWEPARRTGPNQRNTEWMHLVERVDRLAA